jgi:phage gp36-like protein
VYATVEDMIGQWGEAEMIRLTAPEGQLDELVVTQRVERALADASAVIDSYLRKRYGVPLAAPVPAEVARACRILARHELAHGEQREPTEQMHAARKDVLAWLRDLAEGRAELAIAAAPAASGAGARILDRDAAFTAGTGLIG